MSQIDELLHAERTNKKLPLSADAFYHPENSSFNQAIVRIDKNGNSEGTGSFISDKGLILTDYEVVYDALASASSPRNNYLTKGFYADSVGNELPLRDYTLRILLEQKEVTEQINRQLSDTLTYRERYQQSQQIQQQIIAKRTGDRKDIIVEINDFWGGTRQFMSVYQIIRDIRLVHAPPKSIGNFGGIDNKWEWPYYAGSYAFLRAYTGKSGQAKSHDKSNVPFQPEKHLTVSTEGIRPGDLTMSLGFPQETHRYESSHALQFYEEVRNPILIDSYKSILESLQYAADRDKQSAIRHAAQRALAAQNVKYYQSLHRLYERHNILKRKEATEQEFSQWIKKDSLRNQRYHRVLNQLDQAYDIASQTGDLLYALFFPLNNSKLLQIAGMYNSYRQQLSDSSQSNLNKTVKQELLNKHRSIINTINIEAQNLMLSRMIQTLSNLPDGKVMFYLLELFESSPEDSLKKEIRDYFNKQQEQSIIYDPARAERFLALPADSARARPVDDMVKLYQKMTETYQFSRKNYFQHLAYLRPARERFVEGLRAQRSDFAEYPDANNTLRFSIGTVQGFQTQDGNHRNPFAYMREIPYDITARNYSNTNGRVQFYPNSNTPKVINFLTTNDITNGNQGSPVLNKDGEIVGVVNESNFGGIMNNYRYNAARSRSINTDIRYILSVMANTSKAERLLREIQ